MRSLRARLLFRTTAVLVVIFFLAALALYFLMRAALHSEIDSALLLEARALASHIEQAEGRINIEMDVATFPEYAASAENPHFFQVWEADDRSAARSPSLAMHDLQFPERSSNASTHVFVRLPNGRAGRQVSLVFQPRPADEDEAESSADTADRLSLTLAVARQTTELERTLATLRWMLFAVTLAAALGSVALTSGVVRRELRPLEGLARSIERVGAADLSQRIAVDGCPVEVVPVVHRLNDLLARLDEALIREKSFTADAAHELRTPLAGLETALEVCASRQRDPQTYHDVIVKCLRIAQGMHALVNNLLILARADARQLPTRLERVAVAPFLAECWSGFASRANEKRLEVAWQVDQDFAVAADSEQMQVVFANLFDNAVTYANDGGWVRVSAAQLKSQTVVTIANSGCRLSAADATHVFDRFWRGDAARSETGLRCGVGLSLCRKIVELLGGTITACVQNEVFSVTVTLPAINA
jgi:signal transduction histidine kinase